MTTHLKRRPRRYRVGMSTTDHAFDQLVPEDLRHLSQVHWTPVDVAIRAASLLAPGPHMRILDIGSGVGKLCAIGALSSAGTWCGIERYEALVAASRRLTRALGVGDRTHFVQGDALAIDWTEFDALYLYNPFELPVFSDADADRQTIDFSITVARVQDQLAALRGGTRVLTLHGFGGIMPSSFELLYQERVPVVGLDLVLWIQRSRVRRMRGPS
jgi:ubiquinone/menaquinone biosynthesis C-methylase UbiE